MKNSKRYRGTPRPNPVTPREIELDRLLNAEKKAMARFYERMSTTGIKSEQRAIYAAEFEEMSQQIKELQSGETAEWFASLPFTEQEG